ncbi:MAG: hypothetical protein AB7T38_09695 [Nitrospirales bacterium]
MSYRHTGKRLAPHKARKSQECIYCPLKKPIAWPIVFLLFTFSPLIFLNPAVNTASSPSPATQETMIEIANPEDIEGALPDKTARISESVASLK